MLDVVIGFERRYEWYGSVAQISPQGMPEVTVSVLQTESGLLDLAATVFPFFRRTARLAVFTEGEYAATNLARGWVDVDPYVTVGKDSVFDILDGAGDNVHVELDLSDTDPAVSLYGRFSSKSWVGNIELETARGFTNLRPIEIQLLDEGGPYRIWAVTAKGGVRQGTLGTSKDSSSIADFLRTQSLVLVRDVLVVIRPLAEEEW
jgi:hypothetical protein